MSGTVNISRRIWDDKAFKPETFSEREAFIWMIMEASYKPRAKPVGKIWVDTERGQLACSVRFMCEAWDWSKSKVDRFLKRLKKRDMIDIESGTGINVITVCKYDDYQSVPEFDGTAKKIKRDSSGTAVGQQRDKPNKGLIPDVIKEKEATDVASKATPPQTPVSSDLEYAVSRYNAAAEKAGWPKVQKLSAARSKKLKARLKDCDGLPGWEAVLRKAFASDFLRGRSRDPWTAFAFDWLVTAGNFTKVMEGNYDNRDHKPNAAAGSVSRRGDPHSGFNAGTDGSINKWADRDRQNQEGHGKPDGTGETAMDSGAGDGPSEPLLRLVTPGACRGGRD
jgi:hypothetical protein